MSIYANNNENLTSVFDAVGIGERQVENLVPKLSPAYSRPVLSIITDQLMGGIQKVKSGQRKFTIYRQDNDYPSATIATRQTSGSNLVLSFMESDFAAIPRGNMVKAVSGAIGKVEAVNNGSMVVSFVANASNASATSFSASDFAAGEQVSDRGGIGDINNRESKTTVFSLPSPSYNIISQMDTSCYLSHDDLNTKTYLTNKAGQKFYAYQKDVQTLERFYQQYITRTYDNIPAVFGGSQPVGASLLNQILTMGGGQTSLGTTATFSVQQLRDAIRQYKASGGFTTDEILVIGGSQYVGNWQEALENYVIQSGNRNTIGGEEVVGINVMTYGFQGLTFKVATDAILDNQRMWGTNSAGFSTRSNSAIWAAVEKVKTETGELAPFACSYYFGESDDIQRWVIEGSMDENGKRVKKGSNEKKGVSIEYTWDKVDQLMNPRACWYHGA